ncbi:MAG TPA: hypothetical protein DEH05_13135 [Propionibacteriaceae bacterium]|nr:hypothetical protein [Propionibacteriaceae bacterium]
MAWLALEARAKPEGTVPTFSRSDFAHLSGGLDGVAAAWVAGAALGRVGALDATVGDGVGVGLTEAGTVAELEGDVGVATGVLQALKTTSRVPPTAAITNAR